tara:strand:+ start:174 stop:344 length:171 start_codon:yes stop_codon:yes gene_type:complete
VVVIGITITVINHSCSVVDVKTEEGSGYKAMACTVQLLTVYVHTNTSVATCVTDLQ